MDKKLATKALVAFLKPLVRASAKRTSLPVVVSQSATGTVISVKCTAFTRRLELECRPFDAFPESGTQFASTILACIDLNLPVELECCNDALHREVCQCTSPVQADGTEGFRVESSATVSCDVLSKALLSAGGDATRPQLDAIAFTDDALFSTNGKVGFRHTADYTAALGAKLHIDECALACALAKVCKADAVQVRGSAMGVLTSVFFEQNGVRFDSLTQFVEKAVDFGVVFAHVAKAPSRYVSLDTAGLKGIGKRAKSAAVAMGIKDKRPAAMAVFAYQGLEIRMGLKKEWANTRVIQTLEATLQKEPSEPVAGIDPEYLEAAAEALDFGSCSMSQVDHLSPFVFDQGDHTVLVMPMRLDI